jgi:hypothetical protein
MRVNLRRSLAKKWEVLRKVVGRTIGLRQSFHLPSGEDHQLETEQSTRNFMSIHTPMPRPQLRPRSAAKIARRRILPCKCWAYVRGIYIHVRIASVNSSKLAVRIAIQQMAMGSAVSPQLCRGSLRVCSFNCCTSCTSRCNPSHSLAIAHVRAGRPQV